MSKTAERQVPLPVAKLLAQVSWVLLALAVFIVPFNVYQLFQLVARQDSWQDR